MLLMLFMLLTVVMVVMLLMLVMLVMLVMLLMLLVMLLMQEAVIQSYITGMLTNFKALPLDRMHNMLKMFVTDPPYTKKITVRQSFPMWQ